MDKRAEKRVERMQPMIVISHELEETIKEMESKINDIFSTLKLDKPKREELYTIEEVAKALKLTRQTIFSYRKKGVLKFTKVGRRYLIPRRDVEEFIEQGFA